MLQKLLTSRAVATAILPLLLVPGCRRASSNPGRAVKPIIKPLGQPDYRIRVLATTGHVADMLAQIGGEYLDIEVLMGPGVDPHLYKPTPDDRRKLNEADVVFYSGLHLEGRLAGLLEELAERRPVYAVTDALRNAEDQPLHRVAEGESTYDPHVWFDVALWARCAEYTTDLLARLDPDHAEAFRSNGKAYVDRLNKLNQWCRRRLAEIPESRRMLVTAHDAFGYFGAAYDVEVRGLQGISTADQANVGAMNELVDLLVDRQVKAVFVESSVNKKAVQSLVEACRARGHEVTIGGELFSDALGQRGTPEETYVGVVRYNVETIVDALK